MGDESIMSKKVRAATWPWPTRTQPRSHLRPIRPQAHGTSATPVQSSLKWGCDVKLADRICNHNRHYAGVCVCVGAAGRRTRTAGKAAPPPPSRRTAACPPARQIRLSWLTSAWPGLAVPCSSQAALSLTANLALCPRPSSRLPPPPEHSGYFLTTRYATEARGAGELTYYDSNTGKPLFVAPRGRSFDEFLAESRDHGWPSFRDAEVVWENVRVLPDGETVSVDGTHLGHDIPDGSGNRSEAGRPRAAAPRVARVRSRPLTQVRSRARALHQVLHQPGLRCGQPCQVNWLSGLRQGGGGCACNTTSRLQPLDS